MNDSLKKIIDLAKKTKDRVIVTDNEGSDPYVIMDFDQYQSLISGNNEIADLTENEFLNKINKDVSIWKAKNEVEEKPAKKEEIEEEQDLSQNSLDLFENEEEKNTIEDDERFYFEPVE